MLEVDTYLIAYVVEDVHKTASSLGPPLIVSLAIEERIKVSFG